jgi:adenosylcobinamide kinase/adenosylcobinamide-phosphate guanylyltransferase
MVDLVHSELILGGQRSGKSRRAEALAQQWLAQDGDRQALLIATAQAWDSEMRERIERHQRERAQRVPGMTTLEEPRALAQALTTLSGPSTLLVVDCLTLWLTNLLMPVDGVGAVSVETCTLDLCRAIATAGGPVVLVGNEIGMGVIPMGTENRAFVDALGTLNQTVASVCDRVTLMAAGLPLTLKAPA